MKKAKGRIYEFNPVIYPTRLWIAILPDFKDVEKEFYFLDDDGEIVYNAREEFDSHVNAIATTFAVKHKESGWMGSLVVVWRKRQCTTGIYAHEATHVYDWLDKEIGLGCQDYGHDEPKAYYVQWVANCIEDVIKGRA